MRALVAGLGLIGGSIGMALRERGWEVSFIDPAVTLEEAEHAGAANRRVEDFEDSDVVILATPVDVARSLLDYNLALRATLAGGAVVTTVCSVMALFSGGNVIAGHPLAGSQERGLLAARGNLFAGRRWFVDRSEDHLSAVIAACGAVAEVVDPAEHDRAVARTSHLPQILSTALASMIDEDLLRFAGSGLRTFLRLAGSDSSVWRPVINANRDDIAASAAELRGAVEELLDGNDERFARAARLHRQLDKQS